MSKELDKQMAKLAAMGITVSVKLSPHSSEGSPSALIRDAAKSAGIHYGDDDDWATDEAAS